MTSREIIVSCEHGITHHVATQFVKTANEFQSTLRIGRGEESVNAKSLLGILALGITPGEQIIITADGYDEEDAAKALADIL